jgi:hypothetical protein
VAEVQLVLVAAQLVAMAVLAEVVVQQYKVLLQEEMVEEALSILEALVEMVMVEMVEQILVVEEEEQDMNQQRNTPEMAVLELLLFDTLDHNEELVEQLHHRVDILFTHLQVQVHTLRKYYK